MGKPTHQMFWHRQSSPILCQVSVSAIWHHRFGNPLVGSCVLWKLVVSTSCVGERPLQDLQRLKQHIVHTMQSVALICTAVPSLKDALQGNLYTLTYHLERKGYAYSVEAQQSDAPGHSSEIAGQIILCPLTMQEAPVACLKAWPIYPKNINGLTIVHDLPIARGEVYDM